MWLSISKVKRTKVLTWSATFTKPVLDSIDPPGKKGPFLVNLEAGFSLNVKHKFLHCGTIIGATWLVLDSPTGHLFFFFLIATLS